MGFRITGLSAEPFRHLYGLTDSELKHRGIVRRLADATTSYTDRIEMRDAQPGETVLLLNHVCQPADTPYRASHAIYILEGAEKTYVGVDEIPEVMLAYPQSLRAFDEAGMLVEADLAMGDEVKLAIERLFANPRTAYIHAHNAKQGCYAGRIDRT
jgi:Protein of unknown function (DUF1203)